MTIHWWLLKLLFEQLNILENFNELYVFLTTTKKKHLKIFRCSILSRKWYKSKADEGYGCFDVGVAKRCMEKYYISFIIVFKILFARYFLINIRISCDVRFIRLTTLYKCLTFKRIRRSLCRQKILLTCNMYTFYQNSSIDSIWKRKRLLAHSLYLHCGVYIFRVVIVFLSKPWNIRITHSFFESQSRHFVHHF